MKNLIFSQISIEDLLSQLQSIIKESIQETSKVKADEDVYLTLKEAAELTRTSLPTLHDYANKGVIKKYKFGRRTLLKKSDLLNAFVEIDPSIS